jgi:hypothetical protein
MYIFAHQTFLNVQSMKTFIKKTTTLIAAACIAAGATVAQTVTPDANGAVYVTENGAGDMNGSSWENAFQSLVRPLLEAAIRQTNNDENPITRIYLAAGVYYYHPFGKFLPVVT